jgi:putative transposase
MSDRYAKNPAAVFRLQYHLVWCPKYRRAVLVPPVDKRLKQLLRENAGKLISQFTRWKLCPTTFIFSWKVTRESVWQKWLTD